MELKILAPKRTSILLLLVVLVCIAMIIAQAGLQTSLKQNLSFIDTYDHEHVGQKPLTAVWLPGMMLYRLR